MNFQKAERKKAKLRLALAGPSGSGKTYSAIQIAKGMGGKIAVIDTERGSAELYGDMCDYDVCQLSAPFTPQKYLEAIKEAEKLGYDVIVVDSLSHAWAGEGGLLDIHDKATKAQRGGNSYTAWREVTPWHNKLVDAVLQSPAHMIVTLRTKTAYELQDDNGKKKPVKVGLAPVFRDGIEYEVTVFLDLSIEGNVASASKDRTRMFRGQYFTPTAETGVQLRNWLESGVDAPAPASNEVLLRIIKSCDGDREKTLSELTQFLGREITSTKELTAAEAAQFLAAREQFLAEAA